MKIPEDLRWKDTGRTLGAGGQAAVREVLDSTSSSEQPSAMKILSSGKPRQAYERFYREIEAIKSLDHPLIIKILDHSEPDAAFHYYVMESFEGAQPLRRVIESSANPYYGDAARSLDLVEQILEVLTACEKHSPRIVHRDLKPGNILLLRDGSIRIIDFGICQIEGDTPITMDDEGVGTANYMSPECESGAQGEPTVASDLYSVGKILWSVISGKRAFARENPVFATKSMPDIFPDSPETWHLHHIFEKTIRKSPTDRARSAEACCELLHLVRSLINNGNPPLELIWERCPLCGIGTLHDFDGSHMVFGNPMPKEIGAAQCSYCGSCFAVNFKKVRKQLADMKTLD